MQRTTIRLQALLGLDAKKRGVIGFFKSPIFDVRLLLGAISVALITLAMLPYLNFEHEHTPPRIARGEHGFQISSLAFSPSGTRLATTDNAGRVKLRAREKDWQNERFLNFPGYARSVAFSPDGRSLAAAGYSPHICLWDLHSTRSTPINTMPSPTEEATRVLFSPDGQTLAVWVAAEGTVRLWNLATWQERKVLNHLSPVLNIAFSPDGRRMVTGGRDDLSIRLWDLETGSRLALLMDDDCSLCYPTALAFSPDGALLASASLGENCIRLWDLNSRRAFRIFAGHARSVNSVAFSPDGNLLATASNDGTLGLWAVETGQRRVSMDAKATALRTVAFSPDGRTLVLATGDDDDLRWWDVAELLRPSTETPNATTSRSPPIVSLERRSRLALAEQLVDRERVGNRENREALTGFDLPDGPLNKV